ncbi:MAG: glycosyltransferase [Candidatus Omnitrophota bacterium]
MRLSVVIPAYNEAGNIGATANELLSATSAVPGIDDIEIIVIDDRSSDGILDKIAGMGDPRIICIRLSRRSGSHTAMRAGIREATGDLVLCISADGQDDPSCIGLMIEKCRSGADVVWALRKSRKAEPWHIRKPAQAFYRILELLGGVKDTHIDMSRAGFCLMDKTVARAVNDCLERKTSLFGLIVWLGFNQDSVEYGRRPRRSGTSGWSFGRYVTLAKDWIIGFSGLPITLMSVFGGFVILTGFIYALYIIMKAFSGRAVSPWQPIMTAVLLLGGIQMVMLGVIGEYIWHNLDESRKRPLYLIEKRSDRLQKEGKKRI